MTLRMQETTLNFKDLHEKIAHIIHQSFFGKISSKAITQTILKVSDLYVKDDKGSHWKSKEFQTAYLSHFLPMNILRLIQVLERIKKYDFLNKLHWYELGSGVGALDMALQQSEFEPTQITLSDSSSEAKQLYHKLFGQNHEYAIQNFKNAPQVLSARTLFVFCFSLTECATIPDWIYKKDHVLIVEPALKSKSKRLIKMRQKFIDSGFEVLAPCTHNQKCPMEGGREDWCHDTTSGTPWAELCDYYSYLPFKTHRLGFSYLLVSRGHKNLFTNQIRVIGDPLKEKGKSKIMICQDSEREFAARLKKDGPLGEFSRGELIAELQTTEKKSNEWRLKPFTSSARTQP